MKDYHSVLQSLTTVVKMSWIGEGKTTLAVTVEPSNFVTPTPMA